VSRDRIYGRVHELVERLLETFLLTVVAGQPVAHHVAKAQGSAFPFNRQDVRQRQPSQLAVADEPLGVLVGV